MTVWDGRCQVLVMDTPSGVCGDRLKVDGHCAKHGIVPFAPCRAEVDTGLWDPRLGSCYTTHVDIKRDQAGAWPETITYRGHAYRQAVAQFETGPRRYVRVDRQREGRPKPPPPDMQGALF